MRPEREIHLFYLTVGSILGKRMLHLNVTFKFQELHWIPSVSHIITHPLIIKSVFAVKTPKEQIGFPSVSHIMTPVSSNGTLNFKLQAFHWIPFSFPYYEPFSS